MKLTYRGHDYEQQPIPMEMADSEVRGRYRGRQFQFAYPRHIPVPQPTHDLRYRGVDYHTDEWGATGTAVASPVGRSRTARTTVSRSAVLTHTNQGSEGQLENLSTIHRLHLERRLQHRLEVARKNGNDTLVRQLEQEMHSF